MSEAINLAELVIQPSQGIVWELGGTITCKVAAAHTEDAYSVLLIKLEQGQGAPWHIHQHEDELFYILEGCCTFGIGKDVGENNSKKASEDIVVAEAGTTVILTKGLAHFFRNDAATPMKALITAVPGGLDRYFAEVTKAIATNNPDEIDRINQKYGIQFL